jgi:hypothetical protein
MPSGRHPGKSGVARRRRRPAWLSKAAARYAAVLLLVSHALCLLHLGFQPHVLSLATGHVLHQEDRRSDPAHGGTPTDRDGHHECKIMAALTQAAVLPSAAVVEPGSCVLTDPVPAARRSQVIEGPARLYLLSPSQSPPRA